MKGFIHRAFAGLCLGAGLSSLIGCACYRDWVDPCWPERYNAVAKQSVRDTFNAQAANGHTLDQTVWEYYFETDDKGQPTDKLNAAGKAKLAQLLRRQPAPDPHFFVQTAQVAPLDTSRVVAVQNFLATQTVGLRGGQFDVTVVNLADPSVASPGVAGSQRPQPIQGAIQKLQNNYQGVLPGESGTSSGGGSGGSGGGGGGSAAGGGGGGR
jgi:hypothetical protein